MPLDMTIGALVALLVQELALPIGATVTFTSTKHYEAKWELCRADEVETFKSELTFRDAALQSGTRVELVGTFEVSQTSHYFGGARHQGITVCDRRHGWEGRREHAADLIQEVVTSRLAALFPSFQLPDLHLQTVADIRREEADEDARLPPKRFTLQFSSERLPILYAALVGSPIRDRLHRLPIVLDKQEWGSLDTALWRFHDLLQQAKATSGAAAEIDAKLDATRWVALQVGDNFLLTGPGPATVEITADPSIRTEGPTPGPGAGPDAPTAPTARLPFDRQEKHPTQPALRVTITISSEAYSLRLTALDKHPLAERFRSAPPTTLSVAPTTVATEELAEIVHAVGTLGARLRAWKSRGNAPQTIDRILDSASALSNALLENTCP